jgi:hypothetical protein
MERPQIKNVEREDHGGTDSQDSKDPDWCPETKRRLSKHKPKAETPRESGAVTRRGSRAVTRRGSRAVTRREPKESWEDMIKAIVTVSLDRGKLQGEVEWNDGDGSTCIPITELYKKCPQIVRDDHSLQVLMLTFFVDAALLREPVASFTFISLSNGISNTGRVFPPLPDEERTKSL